MQILEYYHGLEEKIRDKQKRYEILSHKGSVSMDMAKNKAEQEYDIFNKTQKIDSDFDKFCRKILESEINK